MSSVNPAPAAPRVAGPMPSRVCLAQTGHVDCELNMASISVAPRARAGFVGRVPVAAVAERSDRESAPPVAMQFSDMRQQYDAARLGMWLFLATELMLFAGLFCVYMVFRAREPEAFAWGREHLDARLGLTNTVVLVLSSLTMALALNAAQLRRRWLAVIWLGLTFLGGAVFMAVKSVEYERKLQHNLVPTPAFYAVSDEFRGSGADALAAGDAAAGLTFWNATCRTCHGSQGEGVAGQGKDIRRSEFIQSRGDAELLAFIKAGRPVTNPANTTGLAMPARGGNPFLRDQDVMHIIAYLRSFQVSVLPPDGDPGAGSAPSPAPSGSSDAAGAAEPTALPAPATVRGGSPDAAGPGVELPRWVVPPPPPGPPGLNLSALQGEPGHGRADPEAEDGVSRKRPARGHLFFGVYFLMTGLHGLHVVAGMGVVAWLMFRSLWADFSPAYFTPLDLGGRYWHFVDIVWLFLFPLFYLA